MKLIRSDSPEVVNSIASAGARACWNWPALGIGGIANSLGLLIALSVSLIFSTRAAFWLSVPVFLVINGYVVWRVISSRRQWVIAGSAGRVYVRLFAWYRGDACDGNEQDILVLEASEIASISVRTLEVFLYGPKPKFVEWLVIEPAQAVAEDVSKHVCPLLRPLDPNKAVYVVNVEGRFNIAWNQWRPDLRIFLQRIVQECPSIVVGPEERSELDLNGIWEKGSREIPNAQQRQMLVQATRLGFGCECAQRISQYKHISFREAGAYLAEIAREEAEAGTPLFDNLLCGSLSKSSTRRE
jgi:hypothetical protein